MKKAARADVFEPFFFSIVWQGEQGHEQCIGLFISSFCHVAQRAPIHGLISGGCGGGNGLVCVAPAVVVCGRGSLS